jgi:hypothetical protein
MGSWAILALTVSYDLARAPALLDGVAVVEAGFSPASPRWLPLGASPFRLQPHPASPSDYLVRSPCCLRFEIKCGREIFIRPHLTSSDLSSSR